ncbi:MAG: A24 family peptidase [Eubacterium sp.]|nr:A24 family peptidase [Eubacterium sp.]
MSVELLLCLGLVSISDIRFKKIPDSLVASIFLIGIISGRVSNAQSIVGAFVLPAILMLLSSKFSIGGGDIKLISALGFCIGFWCQMVILVVGMSLSLVVTLITRKKAVILGPFISFGGLIALIMGDFLVKY